LEIDMSNGSEGDALALESLSALSDGELDASDVPRACTLWRDDPAIRSAWHAYHLIGDVLRSDDLARRPRHDVAFVAALRTRLATEPVVLAPEAPTRAGRAMTRPLRADGRSMRWSWKAPSAVAAGFVLVAGALVVTRAPTPGNSAATSAQAPALADASGLSQPVVVPSLVPAAEPAFGLRRMPGDAKLLHDARLDRYLAAHQQFAGTTALGVPSGFLRNAAVEAPNR
jgi:sigma-E factor negative regulatory protein RseA